MEYIANIFNKALNYVDGNNIPFHKIYHDWDFYFLNLKDNKNSNINIIFKKIQK
jgi:hypothetical protein